MGKYFALLLGTTILMILVASGGSYWLSSSAIKKADQEAITAEVRGVATNLEVYLKTVTMVMENMTRDPRLLTAIQSGDSAQIKSVVQQLAPLLPGPMGLRVLLPGDVTPDESSKPRMGYADVELAREAFTEEQAPMVQGEGSDRHLAVVHSIRSGKQVIAVLLASLNYGFLDSAVNVKGGRMPYMELQQDGVVLAASGDKSLKEIAESTVLKVPETAWILKYWPPTDLAFGDNSKLATLIISSMLLSGLIFLFGYKRFARMLRDDQHNIVRFIKDLMIGKTQSNYPVHIDELRLIISSAMQFKRIIDSENVAADTVAENRSSDIDELFNTKSLDVDSFFTGESRTESSAATGNSVKSDALAENNDAIFDELPEAFRTAAFTMPAPVMDIAQRPSVMSVFAEDDTGNEKHRPFDSIFRAYDIRGPVGEILSKETGYNLGRAIGSEVKESGCDLIVIGRDGRNSSQGLCDAVCNGIMSTGIHIMDIGVVPTPVLYFVAHHHPGQSGVMITGSHHGADYNGLKIIINGEYLADERLLDLKRRIDSADFVTGIPGSKDSNALFINEYIGMISEDVHLGRPMKVVIDCSNGAAGNLAPVLLKTLGCEVVELFCDIDGNFPNHPPDPSVPENLKDLIAAVRHYQAEVGIAFDGDGDRLAVIDSAGKIIYPDRQLMLYAKDVLTANRGAEIVFDVKCTHLLPELIKKTGGRPSMCKTGRPYIRGKLKETGAKLGGEMSGSIYFNDRWFGFDDALYTAARLIEILSADSRPSAEVFADFPEWTSTPELVIPMPEGKNAAFVESLRTAANFDDAEVSTIDGLRADFPDGWGLVRASLSRPALIMRFEAENARAITRIQTQFKRLIQKIDPDLKLPF